VCPLRRTKSQAPYARSCNPASPTTGFTVVNGQCPEAYRSHFPCDPEKLDYKFCNGEEGGMDVKKNKVIVPYHMLCTRRVDPNNHSTYPFTEHPLHLASPRHHRLYSHCVVYVLLSVLAVREQCVGVHA
jgi:hypothetical protein